MNMLIEQLARWIAPGDARGVLSTFASGIDFTATIPLGERGARLTLALKRRPDETFIMPEPVQGPLVLAKLLMSRLGDLPWAGADPENSEADLLGNVVCGECGTSNSSTSLLCRRCGNRLLESMSKSQITADEVLALLHILIARVQAESGEPQRSLEILLSQFDSLPAHQVIFYDMGIYLALLERFHDAACYLWVASLSEPWVAVTRPKTVHALVKRLLEVHASTADGSEPPKLKLELPKLDETRMKVALGALKRALQQDGQ